MSIADVSRPPHRLAWLKAIREPNLALDWPLPEWERVVRLARRTRLLARLAEGLASAGLTERVPPRPRRHLIAEQCLSRRRTAAMVWTLERITAALGEVEYPLVLLKGAAYVGQTLPIAAGRLPSDLDILVPRNYLASAQARLVQAGWQEVELDEHDRRYYYEWSHEVPPLRHPLLPVEVDLHHNILPPVASTHVTADALLERLQPSKWASWWVLDPVDQVLHSAAHLFHDSELRDRIRDLVDLDGMLRFFGAQPGFWHQLPERARTLGLSEPLSFACHFCVHWLGTPVASDALQSIMAAGPGRARRAWLLPLLSMVLMPAEPEQRSTRLQELAAMLLLARYHRQRMPMRILLPHLWHKVRSGRVDGGSVLPGTV